MTPSENSEKILTEKLNSLRNPKLIRSFASDPELEVRLKKESESSGRSMSSVIRTALRKYFGI
jgi:predicted DNA-binding protein